MKLTISSRALLNNPKSGETPIHNTRQRAFTKKEVYSYAFLFVFLNKSVFKKLKLPNQHIGNHTLPTSVEPVNEIFATSGLLHKIMPTAWALLREAVTIFRTPLGTPACSASFGEDTHKLYNHYKVPLLPLKCFAHSLHYKP